uniref:F-box domain-containing protein n=1 Tax=Steinernema glaseri TaxID=37863 RepID=A0A1I7YUF1_9BILA
MDSVPLTFCRDVCSSLGYESNICSWMAETLTGYWKAAFSQFAANSRHYHIGIGRDEIGWWFYARHINYADYSTEHQFPLPPLDEFLELSRRYVVTEQVEFFNYLSDGITASRCSDKDMVERVAPFLSARARLSSHFSIAEAFPQDLLVPVFDMFRTSYTFGAIHLPYRGPESERFLLGHLENNRAIRRLTIMTPWPRSEALEKHLKKLLHSSTFTELELPLLDKDDNVSLRFTFEMFKILFDAWIRAKNGKRFTVRATGGGSTGVTLQDVLSMPIPANITRNEAKNERSEWFDVDWTKENSGCLYSETFDATSFSFLCNG